MLRSTRFPRPFIVFSCILMLLPELVSSPLHAQVQTAAARRIELPRYARPFMPARVAAQASRIRIVVVQGDGAINNISQRTAGEPIVEIRDENDNPVGGVAVTFLLPDGGAGGSFADGARTLSVVTDNTGRAVGTGLTPNTSQGQFQIQVTATNQQQTVTTTISQTNTLTGATAAAAGGGLSGKMITILAVIGGAAAAGTAVALSRGGEPDPRPQTPATTITLGEPSVGAPR